MENIIVTRHKGVVEWLRRRGIVGYVISHISCDEQILGKRVYGNLPYHLAVKADVVISIDLPDLLPEQRGKDLSPEEMDSAGATMTAFKVIHV